MYLPSALFLAACATHSPNDDPERRADVRADFVCEQPAVYLEPGPMPFFPEWRGSFWLEDDGRASRGESATVLAGPFATKAAADSAERDICGAGRPVGRDRKQANP